MAGTRAGGRSYLWFRLNHDRLGFIVQRSLAPTAEMIGRPELDEVAMVTPNNFPRVNWSQSCGHSSNTELPEQGTPPGYAPTWTTPGRGIKFDNLRLMRNLRYVG
jgi:hypothetical protein